MKTQIFLFFYLTITIGSIAQTFNFNIKGVNMRKLSNYQGRTINEGTPVELIKIHKVEGFYYAELLTPDNNKTNIEIKDISKISFMQNNINDFWQNQAIKNGVYSNLMNTGFQYSLRKEAENEAVEYLSKLSSNDLLVNDSYLESYLYSLLFGIYPQNIIDGKPGVLNIKILKDINPNASIFPNGTLIITTGLLSIINNEDELIAALAHEVAHYVLDHSIININKVVQRQKRAEFWAAVATGVAAATEIYGASKGYYTYNTGKLTEATAILAFNIADMATQRFGLSYSREQELAADLCAVELIMYINRRPEALHSLLQRLKNYYILSGNYYALSGEGSHPSMNERIASVPKSTKLFEKEISYDRKMSLINSFNAEMLFSVKQFSSSRTLLDRAIDAGVATEEDYVLLSVITTYLSNTNESNLKALEYLNIAKKLNVYPSIYSPKQEAIVLIRLNRMKEAQNCLVTYKEEISLHINSDQKNSRISDWDFEYLNSELEWTVKMIYKLSKN